jgi:epoxide hydrolase-like predicted phosphatase
MKGKTMSINKNYQNIIFDLGGVLIKWKPNDIIADLFKNHPRETIKKLQNEFSKVFSHQSWSDLERGKITNEEAISNLPESIDKTSFSFFLEHFHKYLTPLEKGLSILRRVKHAGFNTYVLSNFHKTPFEMVYARNSFWNLFEGMVVSYRESVMKPEKEIYEILLTRYNLNPHESIFIDDLQKNLDGAKKLGIDGILCTSQRSMQTDLEQLGIL